MHTIIHTWENSYPEVGLLQVVETLQKALPMPRLLNAAHKHTSVTKANGALVAAQSRMTDEFIAADGTTSFEQESIWNGTEWLLLNSTAYEYDEQQRVVKTTHGNGRFSTTAWMCCGRLSETNEDGITTTYGYNSAHQLVETIRSEVKDGDVIVTPETITTYTRDAAGRTLTSRRNIGAMTTTESTEYDILGRTIRSTDIQGRVTTTAYSTDGLTTTTTTPAGATTITLRNADGSTARISGTAQRELHYSYTRSGNNLATTVTLANGSILSQNITNGNGQTLVTATPNTLGGFIYTRSEYNAKGQLTKQYQDTGSNTATTAPTLYEYDAFGNVVKQTLALFDTPTKDNSPVVEMAYSVESSEEGVFSITTNTRYNAEGNPLVSVQKLLISNLSDTIESKNLTIDERNLTSTQWVEYHVGTKRKSYNSLPTSNITAEAVTVDGFTLSQTDNAGVTTTNGRSYTANGMIQNRTDGRNNTTTTVPDIAGRVLTVTDAAGNVTTTVYDSAHDLPATVTDAQGNTSCYRYDARGRKLAEWGTGIQPVCFGYDDADRMTSLTTFRASAETVSSDPCNRADDDTTIWSYHDASGMEISKAYADNSSVVKTYDAENRPVSFTNTETNTVIECAYDSMGRRATKKVTVNGSITRTNHPCLWLITWDPTQPVATRPLAIQKDATWYTYGWDLTKNICELYGSNGYIRTSYTYPLYGEVTESGNTWQPIQWSSEYNDTELGLVYYNYRHYNPMDGRWLGRDKIEIKNRASNKYNYVSNCSNYRIDRLGNYDGWYIDDESWLLYNKYQDNKKPVGRRIASSNVYARAILNEAIYEQGRIKKEPNPVPTWDGAFYDIDSLLDNVSRRILNSIENKHNIVNKVIEQVTKKITEKMKEFNNYACGERDWVYRTERAYGFENVVYALGDGVVGTVSYIKHKWKEYEHVKQHGELWWEAELTIHYSDIFEKPYMLGNYGLDWESGVPFAYYHNWSSYIEQSWVY